MYFILEVTALFIGGALRGGVIVFIKGECERWAISFEVRKV